MEISEISNCSVNKVVYWMKKHKIKRRNRSTASYIKANPNGDPFKIKTPLSHADQRLFGLGMGIYWGEGEKVSKHTLRVANTDYKLITKFREFLIKICNAKTKKIRYSLVCFNDTKPTLAASYWSRNLNIPNNSFGKIVSIPKQGKGTYRRKSIHGVCTISFSNVKLKNWIMEQIQLMPG